MDQTVMMILDIAMNQGVIQAQQRRFSAYAKRVFLRYSIAFPDPV